MSKTKVDIKPIQGERLYELRAERKMSIEKLHELSGISGTTINAIQKNKKGMTWDIAQIFSEVFEVLPEYLLGTCDYKTKNEEHISTLRKRFDSINTYDNWIASLNIIPQPIGSIELNEILGNVEVMDEKGEIHTIPEHEEMGTWEIEIKGKKLIFTDKELTAIRKDIENYAVDRFLMMGEYIQEYNEKLFNGVWKL